MGVPNVLTQLGPAPREPHGHSHPAATTRVICPSRAAPAR